ncbi:MAG TPA: ribonuclease P [Thermoplasmatales archaeon]|nr:ribonuclease P [Thermoplasmatales archaeon]
MKRERKRIALQRIHQLFKEAEKRAQMNDFELANRYVILARKIAMKYLVRMPREYKRRFCKNCYFYLVPDKTCRVRLKKHKVVVTCLNCGEIMRYPYLREIKGRRKNARNRGGNKKLQKM